ncbi:LegC family aminotransferase [Alicyclobacillus sp. ALC3]|uniref:LegC family aminotransferase n=1 Tax=Alicyclobacillus sp. ALC3 TaxID=2796143 RepID=UPI002378B23B|nr:LegC family aminotransferase [Alicyclobacillus sp. ALC3]WDL95136.1 LegC family aminotransferase [Alicyclobacillus sp. ALC3]
MNRTALVTEVLERLKRVLPVTDRPIALHEPTFVGTEWQYVKECLDTGWVSSVGNFVDRFAAELASFTGAKYVIPTVNGTAALHTCLKLVPIEPGDEVLVPALTFIATANAVSYCGAIPHVVDSAPDTLGVDPYKLGDYLADIAEVTVEGCINRRTGRRIRALIGVHVLGHPFDVDPIQTICRRFRLDLVEDAAESLGSYYKGQHTGTFGTVAALSFNGNKTVTTGGGGAVLTNDATLAARAAHLTTVAKQPHAWRYDHDAIGYNYRMPNLNAALGLAQLENLPSLLVQKRTLAARYQAAFADLPGVEFVAEPVFAKSNYWLNALRLCDATDGVRDELLEKTHQAGILTRPLWTALHRQQTYQDCPRMALTTAEQLATEVINLPSSAHLGGSNE